MERYGETLRLPGGVIREPLVLRDCHVTFRRPVFAFAPITLMNCVVDCPAPPATYRGKARRRVGWGPIMFHRGSEKSAVFQCYFIERPWLRSVP